MNDPQRTQSDIPPDGRKSKLPIWVTSVLLPLLVSFATAYTAFRAVDNDARANDLKQLEILHAVVRDATGDPDKTLILVEILKPAFPNNNPSFIRLEDYVKGLVDAKLERAQSQEGRGAAEVVERINNTLAAGTSDASKAIIKQIQNKQYHVIVASGLSDKNAHTRMAELVNAGYTNARVIKTSIGFALSLGEYEFETADKLRGEFKNREGITAERDMPYLERQKPHWTIVSR